MIKKICFAVVASVATLAAQAQVKIGDNAQQKPYSGVALEVSSGKVGNFLGFKLPVVTFTGNASWQLGANPTGTDGKEGESAKQTIGTVVYNVYDKEVPGSLPSGLYVWLGENGWNPIGASGSTSKKVFNGVPNVDLTLSKTKIITNSTEPIYLDMLIRAAGSIEATGSYKLSEIISKLSITYPGTGGTPVTKYYSIPDGEIYFADLVSDVNGRMLLPAFDTNIPGQVIVKITFSDVTAKTQQASLTIEAEPIQARLY